MAAVSTRRRLRRLAWGLPAYLGWDRKMPQLQQLLALVPLPTPASPVTLDKALLWPLSMTLFLLSVSSVHYMISDISECEV